jgi:hypothetical protein
VGGMIAMAVRRCKRGNPNIKVRVLQRLVTCTAILLLDASPTYCCDPDRRLRRARR